MAYISPIGDAALMAVSVRESDGSVNYTQVFNNGFTIVYLRASSGADYTDCRLGTNYTAAVKAGLSVGFYHYLTARTVEEARSQAEFFIRSIGSRTTVLRTAMQFDRFRGLDIRAANAIAEAFLTTVQNKTGAAPMILTDAGDANTVWTADLAQRFPLWVIDPDVSAPEVAEGKWDGWTGWLYTEYGEIDGTDALPMSLFSGNVRSPAAPESTKLICVTVAYGDTLTAIAQLFNTTVDSIVRLNNIANPNRIYPGQRLYLRVAQSTPVSCCDSYTVRRGDTLSSIADRFGTTVDRLVQINALPNRNLIRTGQILSLGLCSE